MRLRQLFDDAGDVLEVLLAQLGVVAFLVEVDGEVLVLEGVELLVMEAVEEGAFGLVGGFETRGRG